jgi:disulfide bond formation protein DsbB
VTGVGLIVNIPILRIIVYAVTIVIGVIGCYSNYLKCKLTKIIVLIMIFGTSKSLYVCKHTLA